MEELSACKHASGSVAASAMCPGFSLFRGKRLSESVLRSGKESTFAWSHFRVWAAIEPRNDENAMGLGRPDRNVTL